MSDLSPEERAEQISMVANAINNRVRLAVLAERERCAKIALAHEDWELNGGLCDAATVIARAIRKDPSPDLPKRSEQESPEDLIPPIDLPVCRCCLRPYER